MKAIKHLMYSDKTQKPFAFNVALKLIFKCINCNLMKLLRLKNMNMKINLTRMNEIARDVVLMAYIEQH